MAQTMLRGRNLRSGEGGHGSPPWNRSVRSVIYGDGVGGGETGGGGSPAAGVDLGREWEKALGVRVSESD